MGTILQTTDYPAIRAKLGIGVDDLPDSDIDTIGLLPVAEAMIFVVATDYATLLAGGGVNKTFLQASTLCLCAALACTKLEMQRSQSYRLGDYTESETKIKDWGAMRDRLIAESGQYLLLINSGVVPAGRATRPTLFAASGPTSSGTSWPKRIEQWQGRITPHVLTWLDDGGLKRYSWEGQP